MNIKKLFATLAGVSLFAQTVVPFGALAATYSQELQDAYDWAYSKGVTTMSSIDNANMYGAITRAEMAKMLSVYATEVLGYAPNEGAACSFTDIDSVKGDLHDYIIQSCQLGLMGQGITEFRPYDTISRAEFGTALSRTLWGSKYEGGTPYYANHLNALKAAGIMNQINNAQSTKEVRGYVMLMLMRSEGDNGSSNASETDCDDPIVQIACAAETDACPAECKEDSTKEEDNGEEVVKSGDLAVTASAAEGKNVVIPTAAGAATAVSDMDTLTFKTSEEVEITKVVLERYGYSANSDVANVWLEDEDGNVISSKASPNTKGLANLTIKKDYRTVDGSYNATVVVELKKGITSSSIGFKVSDVTSTAKNVDLGKYKPYTYDIVTYDGANVTITARGGEKDYNFEAGKYFEVSKFKVKAPSDSAILVKGFTLTNDPSQSADATVQAGAAMDVEKYLDKVVVKVDGKEVDASAEINKDDKLVVSFDKDLEITAKGTAEITIEMSFSEDFDAYKTFIYYYIDGGSDFSAIDAKTESRVVPTLGANYLGYYFAGGKVKLTNTKLGNVEYGLDSTDVVVAEGNITVSETIKGNLKVTVNPGTAPITAIKAMRLKIAGEEYEGSDATVAGTYVFSNVEIEKSGKVQVLVDIADAPTTLEGQDVTFTIADWDKFYYTEGKTTDKVDISGSISASKLTIQAAKASLTKDLTKDVEFKNNTADRKVVFEGTYTAKKGDIKLNEFVIEGDTTSNAGLATLYATTPAGKVTFYLSIDGDEVADTTLPTTATATKYTAKDTFSNVEVEAGKTVKVVVEAEVDDHNPNSTTATPVDYTLGTFTVTLKGEDENGNTAGEASKKTVKLKVVESGTAKISTSSAAKNTVLLKGSDSVLAEFVVKPSNSSSEIDLDNLVFTITSDPVLTNPIVPADVTVTIDGIEEDSTSTTTFTYKPTTKIKSEGITIKVTLDDEEKAVGLVALSVDELNSDNSGAIKTFSKSFQKALVYLTKQTNQGDYTDYVLGVDKYDEGYTVDSLELFSDAACSAGNKLTINGIALTDELDDGDKFSIDNGTTSQTIKCIKYTIKETGVSNVDVSINNGTYADYFKIGDEAWRIFSNNK